MSVYFSMRHRPLTRAALAAACAVICSPLALAQNTGSAGAPPAAGSPAPAVAPVGGSAAVLPTDASFQPTGNSAVGGNRVHRLTLRQLGAIYPLQLRGVDGINSVPFSVRSDEIIVGARLRMNYSYSPSLITELSHLRVLVNDEVVATIPVPKDQAGTNLTRDVPIPVRVLTDYNRVGVQLIGHYTNECEDPAHSSLWATVSNSSVLELTVAPVALQNDLGQLPLPFFDERDVQQLNLPFVFANPPGNDVLEAAGSLSSWFGAKAGYRGAKFDALRDLPATGNAVVLLTGRERLNGVATPESVTGPTISVQTNPRDPNGKLLLVMGRDANELKRAAEALALGNAPLSGQTATITQFTETKPRVAYDAPNWLRGDRPVRFGELAQTQDLEVSGYAPDLIRVNMRVPPDLYAWRGKGARIDLKYRYTPRVASGKSTLNVNINQQFLLAFPLTAAGHLGDTALERLVNRFVPAGVQPVNAPFDLPLFQLPSKSQLQFHYYYEMSKGSCEAPLDNVKGTIDPESTIDISGLPHFIAMPDLAAFSNMGFPFTRMADLSDSAVVMPSNAGVGDWSAYLTLMGRMGESTGYPATQVSVVQPGEVQSMGGKDLLVLASGDNQPLITQWASRMPVARQGDTRTFQVSDLVYKIANWWDSDSRVNVNDSRATIGFRSNGSDAYLTGFESPLSSGRSVVVVAGDSSGSLQNAVSTLMDADLVKRIQGSLAVISGREVSSLVADQTYHVGDLGPIRYVQWFLSQRPYLMVFGGAAAAVLLAMVWYLALRGRARARLKR